MKLKKIINLCKKRKTFRLYDKLEKDDTVIQWLGDGFAMYQISGLPYLEKENIFALFDIPQAQQSNYFFKHTGITEEINGNDFDPSERILNESWITIHYGGTTLLPLQSENGILFLQNKYLAPLEDLQLYERRTPQGQQYIVGKAGFLIQAIIFPYDTMKETFVSDLDDLAARCRQAWTDSENKRQREESGSAQESIFPTNPKP